MKHVDQMECHQLYEESMLNNWRLLVTSLNLGLEQSKVPTSWKLA